MKVGHLFDNVDVFVGNIKTGEIKHKIIKNDIAKIEKYLDKNKFHFGGTTWYIFTDYKNPGNFEKFRNYMQQHHHCWV